MSKQDNSEAPGAISTADLKKKTVRSGAITMSAQGISILVQLISTVTLSRLLLPEDFGIIAMIVAITAFAGLFRDMGLSAASIQKGNLTHAQMSSLFWINVAVGAGLTILVAVMSPVVAWFYKRPELLSVTVLLSLTFVIASIGGQHAALMQREMRFGVKAISDLSGALVTLVVSIVLALNDFRYWALAFGTVSGAAVTTTLYFTFSKFRPGRPAEMSEIKQMLGFGVHVTAFEFLNYFHRNLDNILIGRVWGASALGLYSRAYQFMMLPIVSLRTPINAVAFPMLSRLQDQPREYKRYFCKIASMFAFLCMPMMAFLALNSAAVVEIALGKKWLEVAPVFAMLAVTGIIQPVASMRGMALLSLGKTKRYLMWGVINTVCVSIGFAVGVIWGALGVAVSYAIVNYGIFYPSLFYNFEGTPLEPKDFIKAIAKPFLASLIAVFADYLFFFSGLQNMQQSVIVGFICSFLVFAFVYIVAFLMMPGGRAEVVSYFDLAKSLKGRK